MSRNLLITFPSLGDAAAAIPALTTIVIAIARIAVTGIIICCNVSISNYIGSGDTQKCFVTMASEYQEARQS